MSEQEAWFVYILQCSDGTLYTGITTNIAQRMALHDAGKGARYTRGRDPFTLVAQAGPMARPDAMRLEIRVKKSPRHRKLEALNAGSVRSLAPGSDGTLK